MIIKSIDDTNIELSLLMGSKNSREETYLMVH